MTISSQRGKGSHCCLYFNLKFKFTFALAIITTFAVALKLCFKVKTKATVTMEAREAKVVMKRDKNNWVALKKHFLISQYSSERSNLVLGGYVLIRTSCIMHGKANKL